MGRFTVIPENTFDTLQLDAGVLLKRFDIEAAAAGEDGFTDEDILCATTGGINPTCIPAYSDLGEDVDNVPVNMMEFKHLDSWECKISTTGLGTSAELIKMALGAADIDATGTKVTPRADLLQTDFTDLWWVGDKANGGLVAIRVNKALSVGGFSLQTSKSGKGNVSIEITGHVSIKAQKDVPMVFYSIDPAEEPGGGSDPTPTPTYTYTEVTPTGSEDPSDEGWYEYDSSTETYSLTEDTTVDSSKTYYERN